ncbi:MAG: hypothetical protein CMI96_03355 [Pelagibacteraceae bacterium]|nr:hypothetical protein [Pelagibacteraceae bacterium]|tara:strand:- start:12445 stop:13011 length:567 start_codon:yes stop_codon:yes gene_type:complete
MIKISGGKFKRTNLEVLERFVRPTSIAKRETIFSILESYALKKSFNLYSKSVILDIFAGSGSVGLEAISRGMFKVYFYENNKDVSRILRKNCLKICSNEQFEILEEDVMLSQFSSVKELVSIIFIDPPYNKYDINKILMNDFFKNLLNENTIIVIEKEIEKKLIINDKYKIFRLKKYKKNILYFIKLN